MLSSTKFTIFVYFLTNAFQFLTTLDYMYIINEIGEEKSEFQQEAENFHNILYVAVLFVDSLYAVYYANGLQRQSFQLYLDIVFRHCPCYGYLFSHIYG